MMTKRQEQAWKSMQKHIPVELACSLYDQHLSGWELTDPRAAVFAPEVPFFLLRSMCTYGERLPASGKLPFIGLVYQPANSSSEWIPLIQTTITRLSFPSLLTVPGQAWLIRNTCKQNTRQHSSILCYTERWVSCRWPSDVLQPALSKWQNTARWCCWNVTQKITWSLRISGKQEQGGERVTWAGVFLKEDGNERLQNS